MLFNDAPCSMPYSVAMNLRHASVTSSSDADRSPRQRESVNLVSFFQTFALPIPKKEDIVSQPLSACAPRRLGITAACCFTTSLTSMIAWFHCHLNALWQAIEMSM